MERSEPKLNTNPVDYKKIQIFQIDKSSKHSVTVWFWRKVSAYGGWYHSRSISFNNHRPFWSKNGVGMQWGYRTNCAKKSRKEDTCFDCTISLGYITISYTNWDYGS